MDIELIDVTVVVWYKSSEGEERMSYSDKRLFKHDLDWIARQYAEVNNGLCKIMSDTEVLAKFDGRNK